MSSGVFTLPPHYQTVFDNNWKEIMAQQKQHRLSGYYQVDSNIAGNQKRYDQIGSQSYAMRQKTARAQKTEPSDIPTGFRWVRPRPYDKTTWIDEHDTIMLGSLPDPQSPTAKNHAIACNRLKDIVLINAALGTNYTGAQGTTAKTLPAAQQIAVNYGGGANTGMTLAKLIASSFIMDSNDVDEMERVLVYAAKQLNNLLTNVDQVNSVLYNEVRALFKGRVEEFMGYRFIRTQLLPLASGIRSCIAYQKEYLQMGIGSDLRTHIDILPDQSHAVQVRSVILLDATRLEEAGVVSLACDETV